MQTFFLISLFIFGLLFGSFSSVIIYRIKSGEGGIMTGRSHCGSCNKLLQAIDLIPLFSWVFNLGKCRQCKAKVSGLYPILELSTGALFALIGYFLIDYNLILLTDLGEITKLFFWLLIGFISIIYIFYDILFLEISERVLATGVGIALVGIIIQSYSEINIFLSLPSGITGDLLSLNHSVGLLIITIIGLYVIILKNLSEIWDTIILISLFILLYLFKILFTDNFSLTQFPAISAIIGALSIFTFFFIQIVISGGKWMGGGDLRIAILVGLILGSSLIFPGMMLTYFVGSIIGILFLIYQRIKNKGEKKELETQIPFGPFIAIGFFLAVFFQEEILEFMNVYLLV
ncbi:MAG: prepilin peptidase [Candidatus Gracilibacteria bacterium]|nr:prepilin peptidase [Candidatus Gracilibacteria bacterium]MDQ7022867.1 prepilin peptidase [Candidatus Gracilibacteria bacterium]